MEAQLHTAIEDGHVNVIRELLDNGANVHCEVAAHYSLRVACNQGHVDVFRLLIDRGFDVAKATKGCFCKYTKYGDENVIRLLLENGADANDLDYYDEWKSPAQTSALFNACKHDNDDVVRVLLEHGADVNARDGEALLAACYYGHTDVVKVLLEHGATDVNGKAFEYARKYRDIEECMSQRKMLIA